VRRGRCGTSSLFGGFFGERLAGRIAGGRWVIETKAEAVGAIELSDVCAIPAAAVIAEAVVAFELAAAFLEKFGGDSLTEIMRNFKGYLEQVRNY
jgi:hypothetical protein